MPSMAFRSDDLSEAPNYIPLSRRRSEELLAKAAELRRMAATASTLDVMNALFILADRYTALAQKRRVQEAGQSGQSTR